MLHCSKHQEEIMKQEVRESSFVNLLSGWVQQGVENFFATQRILVDLAMRQNGTAIDVMREKLTAPDFRPVAVVKEFAGEGLSNFIEGQKLILGLAQKESEILATGMKQRVGGFVVTDALVETIRRSVDTFLEMQLEYLKSASKQVHGRLAAVKAGEMYEGDSVVELARERLEQFVHAQKKFLNVIAEETSRVTGSMEQTVSRARKTELTELAREAADSFIEAQKKLMDVAARQVHASLKVAGTAAKMMPAVPYRDFPDLTREGFKSFVEAEKAVIESVTKRKEAKKGHVKVASRVKRTARKPKPRIIPVNA
jgi:hypothetical protein